MSSSPQAGDVVDAFAAVSHSPAFEDEPNQSPRTNKNKMFGASHFEAFSKSRTANWRDALNDKEDDPSDDDELDAAALIAQATKALNAGSAVPPKRDADASLTQPAASQQQQTTASETDDSLIEPAVAPLPSAPTSPETHQQKSQRRPHRRVVQDSDDSDQDTHSNHQRDPPSRSTSAPSHRAKLEALAAAKRAVQEELERSQEKQSQTENDGLDASHFDELEQDKPMKGSGISGGLFRGKDKDKATKKEKKRIQALKKQDYLAMKAMSAEQRLAESARIEPGQKRVFDFQDQLNKWREGASKSENSRSASNFKDPKEDNLRQQSAPKSSNAPPAPTPMEVHADKDPLEESFPRDAYLESQSQSDSQSQSQDMSFHITPAINRARPPPTSHDTIETSTSPHSSTEVLQPQYRKPTLAMSRAGSAPPKEPISDEEAADGPRDDAWSKNFVDAQKAKRMALAAQNRKNKNDDSDSDLEIIEALDAKSSKPLLHQRPTLHHRKSSSSGRPQLAFKDTTNPRTGKTWPTSDQQKQRGSSVGSSSSSKRPAPIDSRGLNASLLQKSHQQGRINADKRRAEWHARGGRERKDQQSEGATESQQANVASLLQGLQEEAKKTEADQDGEDEDEEDDEDFQPDDQVDDEEPQEEESEEDDEETAELRAAGLLQEADEEEEDEEDNDSEDEDDGGEKEQVEQEQEVARKDSDTEVEPESLPHADVSVNTPAKSPSPTQARNKLSGPSFISETSTMSPTQIVSSDPLPMPQLNFGDGDAGTGGFSQFFDDGEGDFKTQENPIASTSAGGLFDKPATPHDFKNMQQFPNFFVSQREKERNYDRMEANAGFVAAAAEGPGGDLAGPKLQYLNSQGLLTQHAPVDSMSQSLDETESPPRSQIPGGDDSMLLESEDDDDDESDRMTSLKAAAARRPSFSEDPSEVVEPRSEGQATSSPHLAKQQHTASAFDLMHQAQQAPKEKRKKEKNFFVQDQADESDEDEGFMRGLRKTNDEDDEEENSDEEGSVKDLLDDQKVDHELQAEQDARVQQKDQELARKRDEAQQKEIEKVARGDWRHKKRREIGDLSDSDFSDEEFGNRRAAREAKAKKRKLAGDARDQMDDIANNPETQAFALSYRETTLVEGKGEDYLFLQENEASGSEDDDDMRDARRVRERMDLIDRQTMIARLAKQDERKRRGLEPDLDEYEEDDLYMNTVGSSSPPPQQYAMKIKDRTTNVQPASRPIYRDTFEDIEAEYSLSQRVESAHVIKLREREAVEGGSNNSSSSKHKSFAKRAGSNSSITSMTRQQPGGKKASSIAGLMKPQVASGKSLARKPSNGGDSAISLAGARKASFRR